MLQKTIVRNVQTREARIDAYREPKRAPKTTAPEREAELQKVISDLEIEMRRLVDLLVEQTNHPA